MLKTPDTAGPSNSYQNGSVFVLQIDVGLLPARIHTARHNHLLRSERVLVQPPHHVPVGNQGRFFDACEH